MGKKLSNEKLKTSNLLFGLAIIILSIVVMILSIINIILLILIAILSIALFVSGIVRIINASSIEIIENEVATYKFVTGLLAIILAIIIFFSTITEPNVAIELLILIFAFALILTGIVRFAVGLSTKGYPMWFRVFLVIVGISTIILSIVIFILPFLLPFLDYIILIFLLSISLLINGIAKLILGIIGTKQLE
ncbi:MAG: DUF308 domain-containing protein [Candidatus Hodarchaeota archaeon]